MPIGCEFRVGYAGGYRGAMPYETLKPPWLTARYASVAKMTGLLTIAIQVKLIKE